MGEPTSPGADGAESPKLREVREIYPLLSYHYPGLTPDVIVRMPHWLKQAYLDALPRLIAGDQLRRIEAATLPHMDTGAQQKAQDRWHAQIPASEAAHKPKSEMEMRMLADASGIAFVVEPPAAEQATGD